MGMPVEVDFTTYGSKGATVTAETATAVLAAARPATPTISSTPVVAATGVAAGPT